MPAAAAAVVVVVVAAAAAAVAVAAKKFKIVTQEILITPEQDVKLILDKTTMRENQIKR